MKVSIKLVPYKCSQRLLVLRNRIDSLPDCEKKIYDTFSCSDTILEFFIHTDGRTDRQDRQAGEIDVPILRFAICDKILKGKYFEH